MRNILAHINLLFALVFLISAGSAFGQNPSVTVSVDSRAVDLGLSVYWADRNVGENSVTVGGNYYAWAETTTKSDYTIWKYKYYNGLINKYTYKNGPNVLLPEDDVASVNWGGHWRMPTKNEFEELRNNATFSSSTFTNNNKSITFPRVGYKSGTSTKKNGSTGFYWSSTLYTVGTSLCAYSLEVNNNSTNIEWSHERRLGFSVRPVIDKCIVTLQIKIDGVAQPSQTITCPKGSVLTIRDDDCYNHTWSVYDNNTPKTPVYDSNGNCLVTESGYIYQVTFTKNESSVTASATTGGTANVETTPDGSDGKFQCGSQVTIKATPDPCYQFVKWYVKSNSGVIHDSIFPNSSNCSTNEAGINKLTVTVGPNDSIYEPVFKLKPLDDIPMSVSPAEGGSVSVSKILSNGESDNRIYCGDKIQLLATPRECYEFDRWMVYENGVYKNDIVENGSSCITKDGKNGLVETADANLSYVAVFESKTTNVKVTTDSNKGWVGLNVWK